MTRFGTHSGIVGLLVLAMGESVSPAAPSAQTGDFSEIYSLIKTHAAGVSDAELNRAAVQGLLTALGPRVSLVTNSPSTNAPAETPLVTEARLFEGQIAYLRIAQVSGGLAGEVNNAYVRLDSTNTLEGVVLDLRFADGNDYAAAVAAADLFASKAQPLLNWGAGLESSRAKTNAIRVPVAVLVNHETAGAAEALAALLRETGAGLILGARTAGRAMIMQDFPLSAGGQLRIAVAPVTLGDGSALPVQGIKPDINVPVNPEEERAYYADAFLVLPRTNTPAGARLSLAGPSGGTNLASRRIRLSEAELVRERREGLGRDLDADRSSRLSEAAKPLVNDPVLARALDLVKGLALVRQNRF